MGELHEAGGEAATPVAIPKAEPVFAWRAKQVLALLGALSLLAGVFIAVAGDRSVGQLATAAAAIVGSFGALVLAAGLHRGRAWLSLWARIALVIVAAVGFGHTLLGIANASVWIPVDGLMAVWALLAPDRTTAGRTLLRPAGLGLIALVVISEAAVPLGSAAAEITKPPPDPNAVIVVENHSPRALAVFAGSLLKTRTDTTFVRSCVGSASIRISPTDYEPDGRLMVFIAIDQTGMLDAWSATSPGPSEGYDGSYSIIPIWSRGDLAGTLPLHLVVHDDLSVGTSPSGPEPCTPNSSAMPAGG